MKKYIFILFFGLCMANFSQAQNLPQGVFEASFLGAEFVDKTAVGFGVGMSGYWHEFFQVGLQFQSAFHRQHNDFGYGVVSPYYSSSAFTISNTAQLFSFGRFSLEANANFGWLFTSLQDESIQDFNPIFGVFESVTIANETYRFLQGGITFNYVITKLTDTDITIFVRALQNQALGNVRFGGTSGNSSMQFNLGLKVVFF